MKKINVSKPIIGDEWVTSTEYILPDGTKTNDKPESMTHLFNNKLVYKDDPRIILRGKLDSFQAELILYIFQCRTQYQVSPDLLTQLRELLVYSRDILKHEVLNTALPAQTLLTWTYDEIRQRSHNPLAYYQLEQIVLIDDSFQTVVILLNILRAKIREIELVAVQAFKNDIQDRHQSLITGLNRMSSCFHILMYQEMAFFFSQES